MTPDWFAILLVAVALGGGVLATALGVLLGYRMAREEPMPLGKPREDASAEFRAIDLRRDLEDHEAGVGLPVPGEEQAEELSV